MFIDQATIMVRSGKGGDGCISFHTAKYIPNGGPDGGNGGRGGHVYLLGDANLRTLQDFRFKRKYFAQNGENGQKAKRSGAAGEDLMIHLPLGTVVHEKNSGQILADIVRDGQQVLLCRGGRGGTGNTAYASSTRQAPRFAKAGEAGVYLELRLELKLLADIAIIGMPNVGKSTFLSVVTRAKPEIADYHFTTIQPKIGIATVDDRNFALADVPGLIEGASEGAGLGHDFLRHIERSRLLLHILDASGHEGRDPYEDFCIINRELKQYNAELAERPQLVALNKLDMADEEQTKCLRRRLEEEGYEVYEMCAPIHMGTEELLRQLARHLEKLPPPSIFEVKDEVQHKVYDLREEKPRVWCEEDVYCVDAPWVDRFIRSINFEDYESLHYFQKTLKRRGVIAALEEAGIPEGATVRIRGIEFDYYSEEEAKRLAEAEPPKRRKERQGRTEAGAFGSGHGEDSSTEVAESDEGDEFDEFDEFDESDWNQDGDSGEEGEETENIYLCEEEEDVDE